MALMNENGNYLRVTGTNNEDLVSTELFRSASERHGGMDEFGKALMRTDYAPSVHSLLDSPANANKTIRENIVSACYAALKSLEEYRNWIDC